MGEGVLRIFIGRITLGGFGCWWVKVLGFMGVEYILRLLRWRLCLEWRELFFGLGVVLGEL